MSGRSPARNTYHLELVLPELLLLGLIKEREVAHMVDEDVPEDGEVGVERGDLPKVGLEGGAESAQGGGGVELGDFSLDLLREELSLEIWETKLVSTEGGGGSAATPARAEQAEAEGGGVESHSAPACR